MRPQRNRKYRRRASEISSKGSATTSVAVVPEVNSYVSTGRYLYRLSGRRACVRGGDVAVIRVDEAEDAGREPDGPIVVGVECVVQLSLPTAALGLNTAALLGKELPGELGVRDAVV